MRDEDQTAGDNFVMGFSNPITESPVGAAYSTDGGVTVLGYRPLKEDGDGAKGKRTLIESLFSGLNMFIS